MSTAACVVTPTLRFGLLSSSLTVKMPSPRCVRDALLHVSVPLLLMRWCRPFGQALALSGAVMGSYSIKVVRSKTAIVPVNASLLPRTEEEHERCKRTVYVTNIDLGVEARACLCRLKCAHPRALLTLFGRRSPPKCAASSRLSAALSRSCI